jgi:hypothetical protein
MAYLNNPFFMAHGQLIQYFDAIIQQFLLLFINDFSNMITNSTNVLIYANIGLIITIGIIGTFL